METSEPSDPTDTLAEIQVLNLATFHMGNTSDARSIPFDETDPKNQGEAKRLAAQVARFDPTIICVEVTPENQIKLNEEYQDYLTNPDATSTYYGEVGLVAFEVGRLVGLDTLYGIDHKMDYNYNIDDSLVNVLDSTTYRSFMANPLQNVPDLNVFEEGLSLATRLTRMNHPRFLDLMILANADILTHVGSEKGFEGADEAARYYQRNLRIYSNLNRIPMTKEDRIFILMGGSHTAFLQGFIGRSPKYRVVDTFSYLE